MPRLKYVLLGIWWCHVSMWSLEKVIQGKIFTKTIATDDFSRFHGQRNGW